jgi:hypothetical protein
LPLIDYGIGGTPTDSPDRPDPTSEILGPPIIFDIMI